MAKGSLSHLQRAASQYQEEAEQTSSALRRAEKSVLEKELQVDELQWLLAGMEKVPTPRPCRGKGEPRGAEAGRAPRRPAGEQIPREMCPGLGPAAWRASLPSRALPRGL